MSLLITRLFLLFALVSVAHAEKEKTIPEEESSGFSPGTSYCTSKHTCSLLDPNLAFTTQSETCFNQCHLFDSREEVAIECSHTQCLDPESEEVAYCQDQRVCRWYDNGEFNSVLSEDCQSQCGDYSRTSAFIVCGDNQACFNCTESTSFQLKPQENILLYDLQSNGPPNLWVITNDINSLVTRDQATCPLTCFHTVTEDSNLPIRFDVSTRILSAQTNLNALGPGQFRIANVTVQCSEISNTKSTSFIVAVSTCWEDEYTSSTLQYVYPPNFKGYQEASPGDYNFNFGRVALKVEKNGQQIECPIKGYGQSSSPLEVKPIAYFNAKEANFDLPMIESFAKQQGFLLERVEDYQTEMKAPIQFYLTVEAYGFQNSTPLEAGFVPIKGDNRLLQMVDESVVDAQFNSTILVPVQSTQAHTVALQQLPWTAAEIVEYELCEHLNSKQLDPECAQSTTISWSNGLKKCTFEAGECSSINFEVSQSFQSLQVYLRARAEDKGQAYYFLGNQINLRFLCTDDVITTTEPQLQIFQATPSERPFMYYLSTRFNPNSFMANIQSNNPICQPMTVQLYSDADATTVYSGTMIELKSTDVNDASNRFKIALVAQLTTLYIKVSGSSSEVARSALIRLEIKVCGLETLQVKSEYQSQKPVFVFDNINYQKYQKEMLAAYYESSDPVDCPISLFELKGESREAEENLNMLKLVFEPTTEQFISLETNQEFFTQTTSFTFILKAQTLGLVSAELEAIASLVITDGHCRSEALVSTIGSNQYQTLYELQSQDNLLYSEMKQEKVDSQTTTFAFFFEDFMVGDLPEGFTKYSNGCLQPQYRLKLYSLSKAGQKQELISPAFAFVIPQAVKKDLLLSSDRLTATAEIQQKVAKLSEVRNYGMISIFPALIQDSKSDFELQLEVFQPFSLNLEWDDPKVFRFQIRIPEASSANISTKTDNLRSFNGFETEEGTTSKITLNFQASKTELIQPYSIDVGTRYSTVSIEAVGSEWLTYQESNNLLMFSQATMDMRQPVSFRVNLMNSRNLPVVIFKINIQCPYCEDQAVVNSRAARAERNSTTEDQKRIGDRFAERLQQRRNESKKEEATRDGMVGDRKPKERLNVQQSQDLNKPQPKLSIKPITNDGKLGMEFDSDMRYPHQFYSKYERDKEVLKSIISNGRVLEEKDESIDQLLKISAISVEEEEIELDWYISILEPRELEFQIVFSNPEDVSMSSQNSQDELSIQFSDQLLAQLVDKDSGEGLDLSSLDGSKEIKKTLPAQLPLTQETEVFIGTINQAQDSMQGLLLLNLVLAILMQFSLGYLWDTVNCLQMIVNTPLFNLTFPANLNFFFSLLMDIVTFQVIPRVDDLIDYVFSFEYSDQENTGRSIGFGQLGFETKNFIRNSDLLILFGLVFFLNIVLQYLLYALSHWNPFFIKYYRKIKLKEHMYQVILRFQLEGYIELMLCSLFSLELASKLDLILTNASDAFSFFVSLFIFLLNLSLPILINFIIERKQNLRYALIDTLDPYQRKKLLVKEEEMDNKFDILYSGIRSKTNFQMMFYYIFVVRRFVFVLIGYYMYSNIFFQLGANLFLTLATIIMTTHANSFVERAKNRMQFFNEYTILVVNTLELSLTDLISSGTIKSGIGLVIIYITAFNIAINITHMLFQLFHAIKKHVLRQYWKRQYEKKRKSFIKKHSVREHEDILESLKTQKSLDQVRLERMLRRQKLMRKYVTTVRCATIEEEEHDEEKKPTIIPISQLSFTPARKPAEEVDEPTQPPTPQFTTQKINIIEQSNPTDALNAKLKAAQKHAREVNQRLDRSNDQLLKQTAELWKREEVLFLK